MLDVMSGGRLECAFPLGTGMEYWVNPLNPTNARERFRESMDILMQAWTKPGPTRFDGEFYHYKYLNPFPLPIRSRIRRSTSWVPEGKIPCSTRPRRVMA